MEKKRFCSLTLHVSFFNLILLQCRAMWALVQERSQWSARSARASNSRRAVCPPKAQLPNSASACANTNKSTAMTSNRSDGTDENDQIVRSWTPRPAQSYLRRRGKHQNQVCLPVKRVHVCCRLSELVIGHHGARLLDAPHLQPQVLGRMSQLNNAKFNSLVEAVPIREYFKKH